MRHAHGLFLSQPITTLENVSYISLAQPELKKLWIISQTSYLTVAIISGQLNIILACNMVLFCDMVMRGQSSAEMLNMRTLIGLRISDKPS